MENISQMSLSFHTSISYNNFLTQCTEFPINLRFRSLRKKYNEKILKAKLSSGDLSWIENQYVMVNINLKQIKKTNMNHIMSVYCGLSKTILYVDKSMNFREVSTRPWTPYQDPGPIRGLKRPPDPSP